MRRRSELDSHGMHYRELILDHVQPLLAHARLAIAGKTIQHQAEIRH
jgi:hypothetical protein